MIENNWYCFICDTENEVGIVGENKCECGNGVIINSDGCITRTDSRQGEIMPEDCTSCGYLNKISRCWAKKRKIRYPKHSFCKEHKRMGFK